MIRQYDKLYDLYDPVIIIIVGYSVAVISVNNSNMFNYSLLHITFNSFNDSK